MRKTETMGGMEPMWLYSPCIHPLSSSAWSLGRPKAGTRMWRSPPVDKKAPVIQHFTLEPPAEADTYRDEAGEEVCEDVVSHQTCSQDQLLGLVITRQLRGGQINRALELCSSHN